MNINGNTQLIGLIGWPLAHSFSPVMHNAAAADLGLNWVYLPLPVAPGEVDTAVAGLGALGFRGVNVTVPHKQAVMPLLSSMEEGSRAIGAVNTIVFEDRDAQDKHGRQLVGYNTDWSGFLDDLDSLSVDVQDRDCLILGAGGSARAIAYALLRGGGRVQVLARRPTQAATLAADIGGADRIQAGSLAEIATIIDHLQAPLIVNATPLGMSPRVKSSVWPASLQFPTASFAYDLVYNPLETRFMQQAKAHGCRTSNGLGMLVRQGARAFELWTGMKPDLQVMHAALPF